MGKNRLPYDPARAARADVASRVVHGTQRHDVKHLQFPPITSVATETAYRSSTTQFARSLWKNQRIKLLRSELSHAMGWLNERASFVRQKTLDLDRQALSHKFSDRIPWVKSQVPDLVKWRPYQPKQIELLMEEARSNEDLPIAICTTAGVRTMELVTICKAGDHAESERDWPERFLGRETWVPYVVHGKGNLFREIRVPLEISEALEKVRRPQPVRVASREQKYWSYYDILGGQRFGQAFSRLSVRALGWSTGAHGLRHSFARFRFIELLEHGLDENLAVRVLAGELGHFSVKNTLGYLG